MVYILLLFIWSLHLHNIQVDVKSILERRKISSMVDVIARLNEIVHEWVAEESNCVPEVDWNRIRQLDFQDTIRKRDALASGLPSMACLTCPNFDEDVKYSLLCESVSTLTLRIVSNFTWRESIAGEYCNAEACDLRSKSRIASRLRATCSGTEGAEIY